MAQTSEKAFEAYVIQMLLTKGWQQGTVSGWDKQQALFPAEVTAFLAATQPKLWNDMRTLHRGALETMLLKALAKELGIKGTLHVLRHGFKFHGKTFQLDFVNAAEEIYKAFKPYYDATSLQETSDPSQLEQLKHELDAMQVYHWNDVEAFARVFYRPPGKQPVTDHAHLQRHLQRHLQPAVDESDRCMMMKCVPCFVTNLAVMSGYTPF